jgi:tetrahydromethanopterin S-methyltransferase subunit A
MVLDSDWPVEVGEYLLGSLQAPVAESTLASPELASQVLRAAGSRAVAIVGKTETENIGVEKVVRNVVSNAHIRFLVVCGFDSREMLPGQTLVCLGRSGMDGCHRVIGSRGKKPLLVNLSPEEVEQFCRQVEAIDLVGCQELERIVAAVEDAACRSPGRYKGALRVRRVPRVKARLPQKTVLDPAGFFVIYVDGEGMRIVAEHYENRGMMTAVVEGLDATSIYCTAVEMGLVSRLDHAAYLGRELSRAEMSLRRGMEYVQDAAPEGGS